MKVRGKDPILPLRNLLDQCGKICIDPGCIGTIRVVFKDDKLHLHSDNLIDIQLLVENKYEGLKSGMTSLKPLKDISTVKRKIQESFVSDNKSPFFVMHDDEFISFYEAQAAKITNAFKYISDSDNELFERAREILICLQEDSISYKQFQVDLNNLINEMLVQDIAIIRPILQKFEKGISLQHSTNIFQAIIGFSTMMQSMYKTLLTKLVFSHASRLEQPSYITPVSFMYMRILLKLYSKTRSITEFWQEKDSKSQERIEECIFMQLFKFAEIQLIRCDIQSAQLVYHDCLIISPKRIETFFALQQHFKSINNQIKLLDTYITALIVHPQITFFIGGILTLKGFSEKASQQIISNYEQQLKFMKEYECLANFFDSVLSDQKSRDIVLQYSSHQNPDQFLSSLREALLGTTLKQKNLNPTRSPLLQKESDFNSIKRQDLLAQLEPQRDKLSKSNKNTANRKQVEPVFKTIRINIKLAGKSIDNLPQPKQFEIPQKENTQSEHRKPKISLKLPTSSISQEIVQEKERNPNDIIDIIQKKQAIQENNLISQISSDDNSSSKKKQLQKQSLMEYLEDNQLSCSSQANVSSRDQMKNNKSVNQIEEQIQGNSVENQVAEKSLEIQKGFLKQVELNKFVPEIDQQAKREANYHFLTDPHTSIPVVHAVFKKIQSSNDSKQESLKPSSQIVIEIDSDDEKEKKEDNLKQQYNEDSLLPVFQKEVVILLRIIETDMESQVLSEFRTIYDSIIESNCKIEIINAQICQLLGSILLFYQLNLEDAETFLLMSLFFNQSEQSLKMLGSIYAIRNDYENARNCFTSKQIEESHFARAAISFLKPFLEPKLPLEIIMRQTIIDTPEESLIPYILLGKSYENDKKREPRMATEFYEKGYLISSKGQQYLKRHYWILFTSLVSTAMKDLSSRNYPSAKQILEVFSQTKLKLSSQQLTVVSFLTWKMIILTGNYEEAVNLFKPVSNTDSMTFKKFQAVQWIVQADLTLIVQKDPELSEKQYLQILESLGSDLIEFRKILWFKLMKIYWFYKKDLNLVKQIKERMQRETGFCKKSTFLVAISLYQSLLMDKRGNSKSYSEFLSKLNEVKQLLLYCVQNEIYKEHALIILGRCVLSFENNVSMAIESFNGALSMNPDCILAWVALAEIRMGQGNYVEAHGLITKAAQIKINIPYIHYLAAKLAMQQGKFQQSIEMFSNILRSGATVPNRFGKFLYCDLAFALSQISDFDGAAAVQNIGRSIAV